jgi:hypothetical protein
MLIYLSFLSCLCILHYNATCVSLYFISHGNIASMEALFLKPENILIPFLFTSTIDSLATLK